MAEYERQLIVARTTRGIRKRINEGKRWHKALYGYRQNGKDEKGYTVWIPVESEINNYKYALKRYNEGATLIKICYELYDMNKIEKHHLINYVGDLGKILRRYQYTGYQLTIEGYDLYKRFRKNEFQSISILLDRKYWVKSSIYTLELISIEEWIKVCEKLQITSKNLYTSRKDKLLRARKDIATGIIECGDCGVRYYYHAVKARKENKKGQLLIYHTYFHISKIKKTICDQKPRSLKLESVNEIFKLFYFYFYLVFDNTTDLIEESKRKIKQAQIKIKDKIDKTEREAPAIEKRIEKFKRIIDKQGTDDLLEMLLRDIKAAEDKLNELNIELSKLKINYEIENEKLNLTSREMTYYDVKERILDWFTKLNIEEQRNELIKTIKTCKVFRHYILIDTGKIIFLFDVKQRLTFNMKLLDNLNKDEVYKEHFIELKNKREARRLNDKLIHNIDLNRDNEIRTRTFQYLIKKYSIIYNLNDKDRLISFIPLSGIMGFELEDFSDKAGENTMI